MCARQRPLPAVRGFGIFDYKIQSPTTQRLNDLKQSEFPAYWQAQPKFRTANFFRDDTASVYLSLIHKSRPDTIPSIVLQLLIPPVAKKMLREAGECAGKTL